MSILNIYSQVLAYDDSIGITDSPKQRIFDWARRFYGIHIEKPSAEQAVIAPNSSLELFNGARTIGFAPDTVLSLSYLQNSIYRLKIASGSGAFRSLRTISNVTTATVVINNSSVAIFTFTGASLDNIQVGDIMRINSASGYDPSPYAFNALNGGEWVIIGKNNDILQAVRPVGQAFSGIDETLSDASNDVRWYSSDGVQVGDTIDITGTFSVASQRAYQIVGVTDSTIDFISTILLPNETSMSYSSGSINIYHNAKRFIYIEVDQDAIVRFNNDVGDSNRITPLAASDSMLPGFLHKFGVAYSCMVMNKSINPLNIKYFLGE